MKRILVFSTNYLPFVGGAEIAVHEIARRLPECEFELVAPRYDRALSRTEKLGNVLVHRVGFGSKADKFLIPILGFLKARSLHRKNRFDLVWSIMASQASLGAAFFKEAYPWIPLVLTLQEGDEEEHLKRYAFGSSFLYRLFIRPWHLFVFHKADLMTAISQHLAERARHNADAPIMIVPNGVDTAVFGQKQDAERAELRRKFGFSETDRVIISVSRLVEKNGLSDLVRAMPYLAKNYKLLLVGAGPLESALKTDASNLAVFERVIFAGRIKPLEMPAYYSLADVFVRPSLSEGFGNVFVEAMAAGLPVIATPVGGINDFLRDKENGVFCGIGDSKDIALKIEMVCKDKDLREFLISGGKKTAEEFDWSKIAPRMAEAFGKAVESKKRIVICTGIYPPDIGGPAQYAKNLEQEFRRQGHKVRVLKYEREKQLPIGIRHGLFFLRALAAFRKSDLIIALDVFSVGFPAVMAARLLGKKIAVRAGGDFLWEKYVERTGEMIPLPEFYSRPRHFDLKEKIIFKLSGLTLRLSGVVVFSTDWLRKIWAVYGIRPERTAVIENYYGKKEQAISPDRRNFIFAAGRRKAGENRPIRLKNQALLFEAFEMASREVKDIFLDSEALPYPEFMAKVRRSYAVIAPSLSEVTPNFILDAIRFNKPFIMTKYCGLNDKLREIAILADPLDPKDLAEKIKELSDPKVYEAQRNKIEMFRFEHSWAEISDEFLKLDIK